MSRPTTLKLFDFPVRVQVRADNEIEAAATVQAACDFLTDVYRTDQGGSVAAFVDEPGVELTE